MPKPVNDLSRTPIQEFVRKHLKQPEVIIKALNNPAKSKELKKITMELTDNARRAQLLRAIVEELDIFPDDFCGQVVEASRSFVPNLEDILTAIAKEDHVGGENIPADGTEKRFDTDERTLEAIANALATAAADS